MKTFVWITLFALGGIMVLSQCATKKNNSQNITRGLADTVGFAHTAEQMDSVMQRIDRLYGKERESVFRMNKIDSQTAWQVIISPHDDYSYAGDLYPYVLNNLSAPTVILFGVAHKARNFGIEDKIVFDSFKQWRGPYGYIPVSPLREEIMAGLPSSLYMVSDSLQETEHSVEALLPFLQYYHRTVQIVSILVPYMSYERMQEIVKPLSEAIQNATAKRNWKWGRDFAFAISNDCVHYGDEDWGGKSYARFGADSAGYRAATKYDMDIISECLIDRIDPQRIRRFTQYTVKKDDYREYAWTWCGRYAVPFGMLTAYDLENRLGGKSLNGKMLRYSTSLVHPPIPVSDLGLGITAPAKIRHWVGYVAIGYQF